MTLMPGESREIRIPARRQGILRIAALAESGPAYVSLRRRDLPAGEPGILAVKSAADGVRRLAPDLLLVSRWPLELDVVAGGYEVRLARGRDGTFCSLWAEVDDGVAADLDCRQVTYKTGIPDGGTWRFADLAGIGASSGGAGRSGLSEGEWRRALGVDWLAATTPDTNLARTEAAAAGRIPVLRAVDPGSMVEVSVLPATERVRAAWSAEGGRPNRENLRRLIDAARTAAAGQVFVELGCPAPGMSFHDYELLVVRLQPDSLRLFGCLDGPETADLMTFWGRLVRQHRRAWLLTPAADSEPARVGQFFPRLAFDGEGAATDMAGLVSGLRAGAYVVAAGALLRVAEIRRPAGGGGQATVVFSVRSSPEVKARSLAVYADDRLLARVPAPPPGQDGEAEIQAVFAVPESAGFVRAELRGAPPRAAVSRMFDRGDGTVLATTNFMTAASFRATLPRGAAGKGGATARGETPPTREKGATP